MSWFATAPANIALIKYMGKKDSTTNLPDNASLSYTLPHLITTVELEQAQEKDSWQPLILPGQPQLTLSVSAQSRFLQHLAYLKKHFDYKGHFIVRSANNFPQATGLASSASSFAALTRCAVKALCDLKNRPWLTVNEQAALSRLGSGSSCRSFFSPWALWDNEQVETMDFPYTNLIHQVIIISSREKEVSSSEAHRRVKTGALYAKRCQRAHDNLNKLLNALQREDWHQCFQICWDEFEDMHQLFADCAQPFGYKTAKTQQALQHLYNDWQRYHDGPLVTMDAGPNIHLLYRPEQARMAEEFKQKQLVDGFNVL